MESPDDHAIRAAETIHLRDLDRPRVSSAKRMSSPSWAFSPKRYRHGEMSIRSPTRDPNDRLDGAATLRLRGAPGS